MKHSQILQKSDSEIFKNREEGWEKYPSHKACDAT